MFDPAGPVLGIDPGVSCCGYGAVAGARGHLEARACGVIRTPPSDPLPVRLADLERDLEALVRELRPAAMAVERVLFQANVRTAMSVGQASGLALTVAARARVPVAHYSPNEVKLAVAGYGGAGKAQVQEMVTRVLRLETRPSPADAADALALAVCHLWGAPLRAAVGEQPSGTAPGLARAVAAAVDKEAR
ncbi:MAG: crossover junction endodeoxyribonuclease RuvC [Acidimicrobiia bacterium]